MTKENTSTELVERTNNALPANIESEEADNILGAAQEDARERILKFRKGDFLIGEEGVPLGTEFLAHTAAWTKCWIKFSDGRVSDRKLYRVARGERAPERDELGDLDQGRWEAGPDGKLSDPWVLQYLVPFENLENGDVVVFATPSIGGKQAIADLCMAYSRRVKKGHRGQPIVKLSKADMPTKLYGKVPRPSFQIVGWDEAAGEITEEAPPVASEHDFGDGIPF
jgi:hypothetical protein